MFKSDDIIGDIVFISIRESDVLKTIGVHPKTGHFLVRGYDQLGLWLQHPGLVLKKIEDKDGKPLPVKEQKEELIDSVFLLKWDQVNTIMHYPNREGFDFPSEFDLNIGFKGKKD